MGTPKIDTKTAIAIGLGAATGGVGLIPGGAAGGALVAGGGYTALRGATQVPGGKPVPIPKSQPRQMAVDDNSSQSRKRDILQKRRRSFATRSNVGDATIKRKTLGGA